jgi:hypothetical protein
MVAAGKTVVHTLLDHRPGAVEREKEIMMVELETVLDGVVVDFRSQAAEMNKPLGVRGQRKLFSGGYNLAGCLARRRAFPPGNKKTQIFFPPAQPFF